MSETALGTGYKAIRKTELWSYWISIMYKRIDSNKKRCLIYILREKWGILTWVSQEANLTVDDLCVVILLGIVIPGVRSEGQS